MLARHADDAFEAILASAAAEHDGLEKAALDVQSGNRPPLDVILAIHEASHRHACRMVDLVGTSPAGWAAARAALTNHRLHSEFLLQSDFISHALKKPFGYAGDHALMDMIYRNEPRGRSPYAVAKNDVYQLLPAAAAVRSRAEGLTARLRALPAGSRVLSLACGPALEVQRLSKDGGLTIDIDLLDHDRHALARARAAIQSGRVSYVEANAFDLIKGKLDFPRVLDPWQVHGESPRFTLEAGTYDLVYSAGLYDYVQFFPLNPSRGATRLTRQLFKLLKPGGTLIVGNFMKPGGSNRHRISHQFMMEAYSDWRLIYRSADEIMAFASALPDGAYSAEIVDETLSAPLSPETVIGHLVLTRPS